MINLCGPLPPREMTELHVRTLCESWKAKLSPASRYTLTRRLLRLLRFIADTASIPSLEYAVSKARRPGPRRVIATPEEISALIRACGPEKWMLGVVLLGAHAGLRRSDIMRIAPVHYDAEKRLLAIDQKKTGNTVTIPVTDALAAWLEGVVPDTIHTTYVEAYAFGPVSLSLLADHWKSLKKHAGVNRELWIHDLRRTAAVSLYELTKDLRAVEAFLGHASLASTCGYLEHRDPNKLRPYLDSIWRPNRKELIQ
jgi:integrase